MFYVYVLQNPDGLLYKGQTNNLQKRIEEHNDTDGLSSYTRNKGPWSLVYKEEITSRAKAMKREKFLKSGKGREFLKSLLKE